MNRDWVTLAFGMALVGAVVGLSLRQYMTQAPADRSAGPESPALAAAPAEPAPAAVERAPATGAASAAGAGAVPSPNAAVPAPPGTSANSPAERPSGPSASGASGVPSPAPQAGARSVTPAAAPSAPSGRPDTAATAPPVRLNAMIPVVHRHAMGSCQGMLAASAKGLTYDTTHKGDAFTVAFAEMDQFEVDYVRKNLRVRRRAGKTWNFTNDSADALFVFHRDVAKARERLAAR